MAAATRPNAIRAFVAGVRRRIRDNAKRPAVLVDLSVSLGRDRRLGVICRLFAVHAPSASPLSIIRIRGRVQVHVVHCSPGDRVVKRVGSVGDGRTLGVWSVVQLSGRDGVVSREDGALRPTVLVLL